MREDRPGESAQLSSLTRKACSLFSVYSGTMCSSMSMLKEGFRVMLGTSSRDSSSSGDSCILFLLLNICIVSDIIFTFSSVCCFPRDLCRRNIRTMAEISVTRAKIETAVEIPNTLQSESGLKKAKWKS